MENELKKQIEALNNEITKMNVDIEITKKKSDEADQTLHAQKQDN